MMIFKRSCYIALVIVTPCVATSCAADEFLQRKVGLWESTTTVAGKSVTIRQCVGDGSDALLKTMQATARSVCSKQSITKTADGYQSEYSCQIGRVSIEGKAIITGDLNSAFTLESTSIRTGMPGRPEPWQRVVTAKARRLGPCEAGQAPGDLIMPDGNIIHAPQSTRGSERPIHPD